MWKRNIEISLEFAQYVLFKHTETQIMYHKI